MDAGHTTLAVQEYLDDLAELADSADQAGSSAAEAVVSALLGRAVGRLHHLCAGLLHRRYPRLARPPLGLDADEVLGAVVARMLTAVRAVRPRTAREFFALATRHARWELNDLARRLDDEAAPVELPADAVPGPASSGSGLSVDAVRILAAIDDLPPDERETFGLVRVQGLTHAEAADVLGVATKTVQRRLNRALVLLAAGLDDLRPPAGP